MLKVVDASHTARIFFIFCLMIFQNFKAPSARLEKNHQKMKKSLVQLSFNPLLLIVIPETAFWKCICIWAWIDFNFSMNFVYIFKLGMGWVHFSSLGMGFGFFQLSSGRVLGFCIFPWVKKLWLWVHFGSKFFLKNHMYLSVIWDLVSLKVRVRWLGSGKNCPWVKKKILWVARVLQKIARVRSVWAKHPWVGSNLGSGFDLTHPYFKPSLTFKANKSRANKYF